MSCPIVSHSKFCIIGAGIAGLSLLLLLQDAGVDMSTVAIIDPYFDGGDLARKWGSLISNTPWSKTIDALRVTCPSLGLRGFEGRFSANSTTPLAELARLLREVARPTLETVKLCHGIATEGRFSEKETKWIITYEAEGKPHILESDKLILTIGSEPRQLSLPIPSIPLEVALCPNRLRDYVLPGQRVVVFGTAHSGAIVIRNLVKDCRANVHALYKAPTPFFWDRDGAYDGLKAEAAEIADAIVRREIPIELDSVENMSAVVRSTRKADWVVYAMGFIPRKTIAIFKDNVHISSTQYNDSTGSLLEIPQAWGFGIAYPNRAPDSIHWDVSIAAFLIHAKAQIPSLVG